MLEGLSKTQIRLISQPMLLMQVMHIWRGYWHVLKETLYWEVEDHPPQSDLYHYKQSSRCITPPVSRPKSCAKIILVVTPIAHLRHQPWSIPSCSPCLTAGAICCCVNRMLSVHWPAAENTAYSWLSAVVHYYSYSGALHRKMRRISQGSVSESIGAIWLLDRTRW